MASKFEITETIYSEKVKTVRLADGTNTASAANTYLDAAEKGKAVKLVGDSRYALCALGDAIEGVITSINLGRYDDYSIGGIVASGYKEVTFEGSQAAGTGAIAISTYVVMGTPNARGVAQTTPIKVRGATDQAIAKASPFVARVVSLGPVGTGAVGTVGIVELF